MVHMLRWGSQGWSRVRPPEVQLGFVTPPPPFHRAVDYEPRLCNPTQPNPPPPPPALPLYGGLLVVPKGLSMMRCSSLFSTAPIASSLNRFFRSRSAHQGLT